MDLENKSLEFTEFEVKFRTEDRFMIQFKQLMETLPQKKEFIYVEGEDKYYTHPESWFKHTDKWSEDGTFIRYRTPAYNLDKGRREVTFKYKPKDAKNSIQRIEHNWSIGETPEKVIIQQLQDSGASFNFSIYKICQIYILEDATLVFYSVYDVTNGKPKSPDSFIEIEVSEEKISSLSEPEAWEIIEKYEKILEPLGITPQKRLKKSLFGLYRR